MTKFGFKIKTRGGLLVDNLLIAARDRAQAEAKLTQIYHRCEILECHEVRSQVKDETVDLEGAINLITRHDRKPAGN